MDIRFQAGGPSVWKADAVLTFVFEGEGPESACHVLEQAAPWLAIAPAWRDFRGKSGDQTVLYGPPAMDIPRVIALGMGKRESLTLTHLRHGIGKALRLCREHGVENVGVDMPSLTRLAAPLNISATSGSCLATSCTVHAAFLGREAVLSAMLGLYRYDQWLSDKEERQDPRWLALLLDDAHVEDAVREAARLGEAEALGVSLARNLANGPGNLVTPAMLADAAHDLAQRHAPAGMSCRILGPAEIEAEGMGAFMAVARGSRQEARFAILEYTPKGSEGQAPVMLVGKGITFDSGGISIKPAANMADMKGDMSGAAAVLGVFEALGLLAAHQAPSRPVVGLLPCTENMPGGNATRPGDIVRSKSGKSIEITNTDAEGRLILADALTYGQEHWQPTLIIDIATLTGACVMALGLDTAGLFCDDTALANSIQERGEFLGERLWRLPIWDSSKEAMKSHVADMANAGVREGGALHAAWFLKQFINKERRWAHLDIAAAEKTESPINAKGASGFGVRTLLDMVWRA